MGLKLDKAEVKQAIACGMLAAVLPISLLCLSGCDNVASPRDTVDSKYVQEERKALNLDDEEDLSTAGVYPMPKYTTDKLATEQQAAAGVGLTAIYVDDFGDLSNLREYPGFDEETLWYVQRAGMDKLQYQALASAEIVLKSLEKRYGITATATSFTSSFDEYNQDKYILHIIPNMSGYEDGTDVIYYPESGVIYDEIYGNLLEERFGEKTDNIVDGILESSGLADKVDYQKAPKFAGALYSHAIPVEDDIVGAKHIFAHYLFAAKGEQDPESLEALANDLVAALGHANIPVKFTIMYNPSASTDGQYDYSLLHDPSTITVSKNAVMNQD